MPEEIRFYADEHVTRAVIRGLRARGADVLTVSEAGLLGASDRTHIERAHQQGRVIFTQDVDFLRLHAEGAPHAGVVYAPQGTSVGELIRGLMLIRQALTAREMEGHVEFL
jgi:uncharacterized protein with PIN domain